VEPVLVEPLTVPAEMLGFERPAVLVLGRPTCDDCTAWYAALAEWSCDTSVDVFGLDLTTEQGTAFKAANPWTAHIDFIPFNVLYVEGEVVDQWTGGGVERLLARLTALED
jgi:hypothetical protein